MGKSRRVPKKYDYFSPNTWTHPISSVMLKDKIVLLQGFYPLSLRGFYTLFKLILHSRYMDETKIGYNYDQSRVDQRDALNQNTTFT